MTTTVLGVPSSAGAYCVGVERAPVALREAGLIEALRSAGGEVHDAGDLTVRLWRPDRDSPFVQNLTDEVASVGELAAAAAAMLTAGDRLLVVGGSCLVAVGLCAAVARTGERPRIVYIDRHLDLNTPHSTLEGSLSWMGVAHALDLEGAAPELARLHGTMLPDAAPDAAPGAPLLAPGDICYLGVDETQATEWERSQVSALDLHVVSQAELCAHPVAAARAARESLTAGPFVVHLDVDVLDFLDAPLAENVNGRNSGPSLAQLQPALTELLGHPDCRALSLGQLDPGHASSDPTAIPRLVAVLAAAFPA